MRRAVLILPVALVLSLPEEAAAGEWTLECFVRGERLEGMPLTWSERSIEILARDGAWRSFALDEARDYRKLGDGFRPYSQGEMRALLVREFEPGFEVSGTGNYLVVHPAGKRSQWAERFEELYRSFVQYFAVRGFRLQVPRFPLAAVVFPTRDEFVAYAAREGVRVPEGLIGYYSRASNRILLYDLTHDGAGFAWSDNLATIIHEATHQTAFNTGVHSRFASPPLWAVEGLATMFEAPGVYDSRRHNSLASRVNRDRLETFRAQAAPRRTAPRIVEMIESDRPFQTDPEAAYAHAWALAFYLSEQHPGAYVRYLAKTASRPAFAEYPASQRRQDFAAEFGNDFVMLEARLLRFVTAIP
jgi:hypothetical protein